MSGCYARELLHRGQRVWDVMGVSAAEDAATVDAILTSRWCGSTGRGSRPAKGETQWRARPADIRDIGNLSTWLTPRRELEYGLQILGP